MPISNNDPGLSWQQQREILNGQEEQPDTVKTTNCMHWALIYLLVLALGALVIFLVVWFVLMN